MEIVLPSPRRFNAKYGLFACIGLMVLVVLNRDRVILDPHHPVWVHYAHFKWWLLPHAITAALVLFLGPLQFSGRIRRQHLPWHRIIGRFYVGAVALSVPLGIVIEAIKYAHGMAPLRLLVGTSGFGAILAACTGKGFFLAKRGNIRQHQRWMIRSYGVALVFLEVRCVEQSAWLTKILDVPSSLLQSYSISDLWMYVAFSLVGTELALRWRRTVRISHASR